VNILVQIKAIINKKIGKFINLFPISAPVETPPVKRKSHMIGWLWKFKMLLGKVGFASQPTLFNTNKHTL